MNYHQKREIIASCIVRSKNLQKQIDRLIIYCEWAKRTYPEREWSFGTRDKGQLVTKLKHLIQNIEKIKLLIEGL